MKRTVSRSRQAEAKKPIRLSALEYERTARLIADAALTELQAAITTERAQQRAKAARSARDAHIQRLAKRYGFPAEDARISLDDATRTLKLIQAAAST